jgi:hypothetical protein
VLETAHWRFYRITYIDWQQRQTSAKKDFIDTIKNHFFIQEKHIDVETAPRKEETNYEAMPVDVPESLIDEQKTRADKSQGRDSFGRPATVKKPEEMKTTGHTNASAKKSTERSKPPVVQKSLLGNDSKTVQNRYAKIPAPTKISNMTNSKTLPTNPLRVPSILEGRTPAVDAKLQITNVKKENKKQIVLLDLQPIADLSMDIITLIKNNGVKYVDNRLNKGALWIIGGEELRPLVNECRKLGVTFKFSEGGGRATSNKSGWWAK